LSEELRRQLVESLYGRQAHMTFAQVVADFPARAINARGPNVEYTPWHIVEHLRITQWDILRYIEDPLGHVSPEWPVGYWPAPDAESDEEGFRRSVEGFEADLRSLEAIALDSERDLSAVLEGTPGHSIARELLVVANHNSYHIGEFAALRQVMGSWPAGRR
jgi:hypothetical protein